jgi:diguanylate cyclase (GGDEF)-like protein/PAS domain S-box-containing protein
MAAREGDPGMGGTPTTVGVFSPFVGGFYFGSLIKGIADAVHPVGARLITVQTLPSGLTHAPHREPLPMLHRVAWDHLDGCIAVVNAAGPEYLRAFQASGRPVVMISNEYDDLECATVVPDNRGGARQAVQHLIDHGHRRIAFAGYLAQEDIRERYLAYREALLAAGIELDPAMVYDAGDQMHSGGRLAAQRMLAAGLPSTAVFVATDFNALGLMEELTKADVRLPAQQAIVSFDGMEMSAYSNPSLSTARQDLGEVGRTAGQVLLERMATGERARARHCVPTTLLLRESCGCTQFAPDIRLVAPTEDTREAIIRAINDVTRGDSPASAAEVVAEAVVAVLSGEESKPRNLKQALDTLFRLRPDSDTPRAIIDAVRSFSHEATQVPFADLLLSISQWLADAQVRVQVERNNTLQELMLAQYEVSMDLLSSDADDLYQLGFLERTDARAGLLAVWTEGQDASGDAMLEVVGRYDRDGNLPTITGFECPVDEFPHPSLLAMTDGTRDVVHIAPASVKSSDWGLLAMVGPVETAVSSGREAINQWAALLTVAMDSHRNLRSLNEQRAVLVKAWERERELVEDFRRSQERYILATRAADGGLWDWDLATNVVYYADRWRTLTGYAASDVDDSPEAWLSRVHPDDRPDLVASLDRLVKGETVTIEQEHRLRRPDGTYRWMLCRALGVLGDDHVATRLVGSITDITERKELEDRLRQAALHDGLTGLPNRTLFLERLELTVAASRDRNSSQYAVLFLDLDRFKAVNDGLGHLAGDRLLVQASRRIERSLRGTDIAARMGGDEFAVLLEVHSPHEADAVARRIAERLSEPFEIDGQSIRVSTSIGIARSTTGYDTPEDVLRDADLEMYRAKLARSEGHDRVR